MPHVPTWAAAALLQRLYAGSGSGRVAWTTEYGRDNGDGPRVVIVPQRSRLPAPAVSPNEMRIAGFDARVPKVIEAFLTGGKGPDHVREHVARA
jgi:hypothetical protein